MKMDTQSFDLQTNWNVWVKCSFMPSVHQHLYWNWWLKIQTQRNAQLCRKESNLLLLKMALQWPVRVQVTMATVAAHCREKETLLRYLTPSSFPGTDQCEQRKPHKEMESHRFAHRVAGEGEMRGEGESKRHKRLFSDCSASHQVKTASSSREWSWDFPF